MRECAVALHRSGAAPSQSGDDRRRHYGAYPLFCTVPVRHNRSTRKGLLTPVTTAVAPYHPGAAPSQDGVHVVAGLVGLGSLRITPARHYHSGEPDGQVLTVIEDRSAPSQHGAITAFDLEGRSSVRRRVPPYCLGAALPQRACHSSARPPHLPSLGTISMRCTIAAIWRSTPSTSSGRRSAPSRCGTIRVCRRTRLKRRRRQSLPHHPGAPPSQPVMLREARAPDQLVAPHPFGAAPSQLAARRTVGGAGTSRSAPPWCGTIAACRCPFSGWTQSGFLRTSLLRQHRSRSLTPPPVPLHRARHHRSPYGLQYQPAPDMGFSAPCPCGTVSVAHRGEGRHRLPACLRSTLRHDRSIRARACSGVRLAAPPHHFGAAPSQLLEREVDAAVLVAPPYYFGAAPSQHHHCRRRRRGLDTPPHRGGAPHPPGWHHRSHRTAFALAFRPLIAYE